MTHYTSDLEQRLMGLNIPLLALSCEDPHCSDVGHSEQRDTFMLVGIVWNLSGKKHSTGLGSG